MKRIFIVFNGDPETFSQEIVNNAIQSNTSGGSVTPPAEQQVYVPTNQQAKKFLYGLTGTPVSEESVYDPSQSTLTTRNRKIPVYGNPIKRNQFNEFNTHGDVTTEDLFPSQTNAVAGTGSTPIWGAYPLWDAGVKFPFGVFYKGMNELEKLKLAAMQAKTQEVKPFNPEQVASAPNIQGALDQYHLNNAVSIGNKAVQRGGQMSDVFTDPTLSKEYYDNLSEYKGTAAQSKAVYDAATQVNKDFKDNKMYVSPEVKEMADGFLSMSPETASRLIKTGQIKDVLPRVLEKLETYQTVANTAEPIAERMVNSVIQNIQSAKDEHGKPIPTDQYGKYFEEHDVEGVVQGRIQDAAKFLVKQNPALYGVNGTGVTSTGKKTPYNLDDAEDYLTNRFAMKVSDRLQIAYSPKINTVKEATETNYVPNVVGDIVGAATQAPNGTVAPIGVNTGSQILSGKYFNTYIDKTGNAVTVAKNDAVGNYTQAALHVTKDKSLTSKTYDSVLEDFHNNPATQRQAQSRVANTPGIDEDLVAVARKQDNPVYRGNYLTEVLGGIPVGDAIIKKVKDTSGGVMDKKPFSFDMDIKDNGRNRSVTGVVIPGSYVESHSGIFKDAVDGSIGIGGSSLYIQGTYIPHLDKKDNVEYYTVGDINGKSLATGNKLADIRIPKSEIDGVVNTGFKMIDGVQKGSIPSGESSTHKGIGREPMFKQTLPDKSYTKQDLIDDLKVGGFEDSPEFQKEIDDDFKKGVDFVKDKYKDNFGDLDKLTDGAISHGATGTREQIKQYLRKKVRDGKLAVFEYKAYMRK